MQPYQVSQEVSIFKFPHWGLQTKDFNDIIILHHWDRGASGTESVFSLTVRIWFRTEGKASNKKKSST